MLFAIVGTQARKVQLSGTIGQDSVRVLLKEDTTYLNQSLTIKGTLIVEPGARIEFYDNSRIIVAAGGRIIADGFANLAKKARPGTLATPTQVVNAFADGFHDMRCFLFPIGGGGTAANMTAGLGSTEWGTRERTIHPFKYNTIFNVAVDIENRKLVNINPMDPGWPRIDTADRTGRYLRQEVFRPYNNDPNTNIYVIPYETAIMFWAARMNEFPSTNPPLVLNDWLRLDGSAVDVVPRQIQFVGQPQGQFSREWGHIVVLPGARAAFFRNCLFENIRKDTTVDNVAFYENVTEIDKNLSSVELNELNKAMIELTNGGGGAITTFSSRTWILDSKFSKNFARLRGGAVQILQAPTSYFYSNRMPLASDTVGCARFNFDDPALVKNYRVTDENKLTSTVMTRYEINYPRYPMIDRIDEPIDEDPYFVQDIKRQAWDDARLAGYLGRFRNLDFDSNMVRLANVDAIPNQGGSAVTRDDTTTVVLYPYRWGNGVKGGAMYISGTEDEGRQIEFTLGMNDSIRLGDFPAALYNPNNLANQTGYKDYLRFVGNSAQNYQDNKYSDGAKGGAIYVGKNTSLIVAGQFIDNHTDAKWLVDTTGEGRFTKGLPTPYVNGILYSAGGAIYSAPDAYGRIQIRGDREKDAMRKRTATFGHPTATSENSTMFINNRAGAGGAIYVDESPDVFMSPQIGGSDENRGFNNYGWKVRFANNKAYSAGGAIYTKRNMDVNGAGGARENYAYSLAHLVRFDSNSAGFAGGAIHVEIPIGNNYEVIPNTRIINLRRAEFKDNHVNKAPFIDDSHLNNELVGDVRGGGAIYSIWADFNVVRGVRFVGNVVYNGNGGAIQMVRPNTETPRLFITDLDVVHYADIPEKYRHIEGLPLVASGYTSVNNPFTYGANYNDNNERYIVAYPDEYDSEGRLILEADIVPNPNAGMLNIFEENHAVVDSSKGVDQIELYGNTQITTGYIMPNINNNSQWWFSENDGFVGGNVGHLVNIYLQNLKWTWTQPLNDSLWGNTRFNAMYFANSQIGYMATNHGTILKTTNKGSGSSWKVVYQSTDWGEGIMDMSFIGGANDRGIAVTDQGRVITTENGENWVLSAWNYLSKKFYGVHLINGDLAYIVGSGGAIVKMTRTGANAWDYVAINVSGLSKDLNKVYFVNSNKGFAIGNDGAYVFTDDGGANWDILLDVFPRNEKLTDIKFVGTQIGYITTASGVLWKTTNGGNDWEAIYSFPRGINSLFLLDHNKLFVVGSNDLVMRSLDGGEIWESLTPTDIAGTMGNPRIHANVTNLVENGIGLGGAIYILDNQNRNDNILLDSVWFNRVRIIDNFAWSGSAIYSDNYNLKLFFNRSLIRGNKCDENNYIGMEQNHITGPLNRDNWEERNYASSDLVSATIYGEVQGPFPTSDFSTLSNSIFENEARFLIRLPDAPNTKGILAGQNSGIGTGGTDTLIGNYWGHTEANVGLTIMNHQNNHSGNPLPEDKFMTFFVSKRVNGQPLVADTNYLPYYNYWDNITTYPTKDKRRQGPFELNMNEYRENMGSRGLYNYEYIELRNEDNGIPGENIPAEMTIPEKYLFSYDVYDLHDKTTDIKTADYSKRRMFPIEDFAVGNPVQIYVDHETFIDVNDPRQDAEKREKYVKRWVRDPEYGNALLANGDPEFPEAYRMQRVWAPLLPLPNATDNVPRYYQPLGMPMYLETKARTNFGVDVETNRDFKHQGSTVFFIINETTQDFIRVDMKQVPKKYGEADSIWADDIYRATVFLVPDSSRRGNTQLRRLAEGLENLGSNGTYPFGTDPDAGSGGSGTPELLKKLSPRPLSTEPYPGIQIAATNEDFAALGGRKYSVTSERYEGEVGQYSGSPYQTYFNLGDDATRTRMLGLFSNRPAMPVDNNIVAQGGANETRTTFFAGERYGTLPANVGDVIRVVSRNVLWRQGITKAYDGGLVFIVREGPEAPIFTGDLTMWGTPELNPYVTDVNGDYPIFKSPRVDEDGYFVDDTVRNHGLLNTIFVKTNRTYPAPDGTYSRPTIPDNVRGTDFILRATAIDRNGFYDPRNELLTGQFTQLIWRWYIIEPNSALRYWLMADTNKGDLTINEQHHRGWLEFKGTPINPYIVPGGERFQVTARNYAPGIELLDSLNASSAGAYIPWFYRIFPPYLNAPKYNEDVTGEFDLVARYLQQDTMDVSGNMAVSEELRIFVMDSLPRFIEYRPEGDNPTPATFAVREANYSVTAPHNEISYRNYDWTRFQAGTTSTLGATVRDANPKFLVNVTSFPQESAMLRFKMDLNTDDELEDLAAESTIAIEPWDFRYGRTAYSFQNITISANDTLTLDTIYRGVNTISQLKPSWMMYNQGYFRDYIDPTNDAEDATLFQFQRRGQMNIRIDYQDAEAMLRKNTAINLREYNTDTMMAIVANDGHGGSSTKYIDLYINFQPEFITDMLLPAVEGQEYNLRRDDTRAIKIFDANRDQRHTYKLIYSSADVVGYDAYDRSFPTETPIDWANIPQETPEWLQINPESGILYGVPTLVRNMNDTNPWVTVLVEDEDGLVNVTTYPLSVAIGNCPPKFLVAPLINCLTAGQEIDEPIIVFDRDLLRDGDPTERLTFNVLRPQGLTIEPSYIDGQLDSDTIAVKLYSPGFVFAPSDVTNGKIRVIIEVIDRAGAADTLNFEMRASDSVSFLSNIRVTNSLGHTQLLDWGTAPMATTGDIDGRLDTNYCEIEIPPLPDLAIFDARWSVTTTNGIYRNIFPTARQTTELTVINRYKARFQAGDVNSLGSPNYPVTLRWKPTSVPAREPLSAANPQGSSWYLRDGGTAGNFFNVNMNDVATRRIASGSAQFTGPDGDGYVTVTIIDNKLDNFHILHDWYSNGGLDVGVEDNYAYETDINGINPHPITPGAKPTLDFTIGKAGNVTIELFNLLGDKVANLENDFYDAGSYSLRFDLIDNAGSSLISGTYQIRLITGMDVKVLSFIIVQ
ncbi:MAG: YCF48-related protein [Bacteroidetes bacterium]|nr:YCF48-related protein [Bacteroidota bacterium]